MTEELKKLIRNSGNNLHMDVVDSLEKSYWNVDMSSYYYDDTTGKPREMDIIASKDWRILPTDGQSSIIDFVRVYLFIECKYFTKEIAFRLHQNDKEKSRAAILTSGIRTWYEALDKSGLRNDHHFVAESSLGKLFDSENGTDVFNAITQPVKALIFFKDRKDKAFKDSGHRDGVIEKAIYYPLVVYSGIQGIYALKRNDIANLDKLKFQDNLTAAFNYSYRSVVDGQLKTQYFCIDLIKRDRFEEMLEKKIIPETESLARHFGRGNMLVFGKSAEYD